MSAETSLKSWIYSNNEGALKLLEALVNINTFSTNYSGVNQAQDLIRSFLSDLGLNAEKVKVPGAGDAVVARSPAIKEKYILLVGHVDTVHLPDSNFQKYSQDKEKAYGPGVLDMKGGLVVFLWALKALSVTGILKDIPVMALINGDEELGSEFSKDLVHEKALKARAALVFEWGRNNNAVITRRKGVTLFELFVKGKATHAGNHHKEGANAILELAHLTKELSELTDYSKGVTVNVGTVKGGSAVNTVPDYAEANVDVRIEKVDDLERIRRFLEVRSKNVVVPGTSVTFRESAYMPPLEESQASIELFKSYHSFAEPAGLSYIKYPGIIGGGSDANRTSFAGAPSIDGLGPLGEFPHSEQEYIFIDSLAQKSLNLALWLASQRV